MTSARGRGLRGALAALLLLALPGAVSAVDDHLLLCEVALAPSGAELVELVNPTTEAVALGDDYLTDNRAYALLPKAAGAASSPDFDADHDFIVRFPAGTIVPPGGVVVVALDGAGFEETFGRKADFEILGTDPATPDMIPVAVGAEASLTNDGEGVTLFTWDGTSDLVSDVDMVNAGKPTEANGLGDKSGLAVDGPDAGSTPSTYQPDAFTMPQQASAPGSGKSTKRIALEGPDEATGGGNGLTGDDETTEDISVTWDQAFTAPDPGSCCLTPDCYYQAVDLSDAAALRATLHPILAGHRRFSYDGVWEVLEAADQDPEDAGAILDLYRNAIYPKPAGQGTLYVREHSWPNSFGFPEGGAYSDVPYTDAHALFLADREYNGRRSNRPYRTCDAADCQEWPTEANHGRGGPGPRESSNWGKGTTESGSWETWIGRRGDVARAQFYMDVRYEGDPGEPDLILTDDTGEIHSRQDGKGYMGLLSTLLEWNRQDPVDALERVRDGVVYYFQRNRNPFVDHPEWAECLFAGRCAVSSAQVPGFVFFVTFTDEAGRTTVGAPEAACIPETLCVSGAVPGRSEVFLRIVGPKPNGYLWPTLVKFSTSQVDIWVRQVGTGEVRRYRLAGATPGSSELPGLFDRTGFLP